MVRSSQRYVSSDEYAQRRGIEILTSQNPYGEIAKENVQNGLLSFLGKTYTEGGSWLENFSSRAGLAALIFLGIGVFNLFKGNATYGITGAIRSNVGQFNNVINKANVSTAINSGINQGSIHIKKIHEKIKSAEKAIDETMLAGNELNFPIKIWLISFVIGLYGKISAMSGTFAWNVCLIPFGYYAWSKNKDIININNIKALYNSNEKYVYLKRGIKNNLSYPPPLLVSLIGILFLFFGQVSGMINGDSLFTVINSPEYTSNKSFWVAPFFGATLFRILLNSLNYLIQAATTAPNQQGAES
jgi:hypothetical protein